MLSFPRNIVMDLINVMIVELKSPINFAKIDEESRRSFIGR